MDVCKDTNSHENLPTSICGSTSNASAYLQPDFIPQ